MIRVNKLTNEIARIDKTYRTTRTTIYHNMDRLLPMDLMSNDAYTMYTAKYNLETAGTEAVSIQTKNHSIDSKLANQIEDCT